jgi:nitrite reductase/ring-hydroxylating ferredoxin subunit
MATLLTPVEEIPEDGSYRFTVEEANGGREEVILLRLDDGVSAWKNFCQHETDQRLDLGGGAVRRDETVICPKHGSAFDVETGYCDNGPAAGSSLVEVDVSVRHGQVYLTDDDLEFLHEGGNDDDGSPGSTSHLRF